MDDYAPDFWLISEPSAEQACGYVTSPFHSTELAGNIAMGYVPIRLPAPGAQLDIHVPDEYAERPGEPAAAEVVKMPFRPSAHPSAREIARKRQPARATGSR